MIKKITKINISLLIIAMLAIVFCGMFSINNFVSKKLPTAHAEGTSITLTGNNNVGLNAAEQNCEWSREDTPSKTITFTNQWTLEDANIIEGPTKGENGLYITQDTEGNYHSVYYANVDIIYAPVDCVYFFGFNCQEVEYIYFDCFDTSKVTSMDSMFTRCNTLKSIDLSKFDTSNVTNMSMMFNECSSLTSIDVSHLETNNVQNFSGMFNNCSGLTSLDVSTFVTTSATDMNYMFASCSGLTSLNLSNFNTESVTNIAGMFAGCEKLSNINLSSFDTSEVIDMNCLFSSCTALTSLDMSGWGWDTSKVQNMSAMFMQCTNLTNLNMSNIVTSSVTTYAMMFATIQDENQNLTKAGLWYTMYSIFSAFGLQIEPVEPDDPLFYTKMYSSLTMTEFTGTEEEATTLFLQEMGATEANVAETLEPMALKSLNMSGFEISDTAITYHMFDGCANLETIIAPSTCAQEVTLPQTMYEQGTTNEHLTLSSESTGKTLVLSSSSSSTPSTGFVDEQLLPALAIGILSIIVVFAIVNKKKKFNF